MAQLLEELGVPGKMLWANLPPSVLGRGWGCQGLFLGPLALQPGTGWVGGHGDPSVQMDY